MFEGKKKRTLQQPFLKKTPRGGRSIARISSTKVAHLDAIIFENWRISELIIVLLDGISFGLCGNASL